MFNIPIDKILIIILVIGSLFGVKYLYDGNVRLKIANQNLIQTQKTQENVITVTDENEAKNKQLASSVNNKINDIKARLLAKNQEDFLNKSECIFSNFGNKDYDCK